MKPLAPAGAKERPPASLPHKRTRPPSSAPPGQCHSLRPVHGSRFLAPPGIATRVFRVLESQSPRQGRRNARPLTRLPGKRTLPRPAPSAPPGQPQSLRQVHGTRSLTPPGNTTCGQKRPAPPCPGRGEGMSDRASPPPTSPSPPLPLPLRGSPVRCALSTGSALRLRQGALPVATAHGPSGAYAVRPLRPDRGEGTFAPRLSTANDPVSTHFLCPSGAARSAVPCPRVSLPGSAGSLHPWLQPVAPPGPTQFDHSAPAGAKGHYHRFRNHEPDGSRVPADVTLLFLPPTMGEGIQGRTRAG